MKRKLWPKNKYLFIIITTAFLLVLSLFGYFIFVSFENEKMTYQIDKGSILFDSQNNYVKVGNSAVLKRWYDKKFYLTFEESGIEKKVEIGYTAIVYKDNDYKLGLYGNAYQISIDGSVVKLNGYTEINKAGSPYFYKLGDRKYLFVDKKLGSDDSTIKTNDYVIIELDKKGNASFFNYEVNFKTIKPIVLKGTLFDFDIANEKLIQDDKIVDLKEVIGSTNNYKKTEEKVETAEEKSDTNYYDEYFEKLKKSFNNLNQSLSGVNDNLTDKMNQKEAYLDLTRWATLKNVKSNVMSLNIEYKVFDPNNEYSEIFAIISGSDYQNRILLSKEQESFLIDGLMPDTQYTISFGYRVVSSAGDSTADVIVDSVKSKTTEPDIKVNVISVSPNKIVYDVNFEESCYPDKATISLIINGTNKKSITISSSDIKNKVYSGAFIIESLGSINEIRISNITIDSTKLNYENSYKFVN